MLSEIFENVKRKAPLIHNITNYVTANDCANILLACGASPIMSDETEEIEEVTSICDGLCINLGTLNKNTVKSMLIAGKKSNELLHPVLLDPVGVGVSEFRINATVKLLNEVRFAVIKGNMSEIKTLALGTSENRGVDAAVEDKVTEKNLLAAVTFAKEYAEKTGAVIVITGAIDIVADSKKTYCIRNGNAMMSKITGTGCQLSSLITAFVAANQDRISEAVVASVCTMGLCGEIAFKRMKKFDGNATYRNYIIDAVYNLSAEEIEKGANYEIQ